MRQGELNLVSSILAMLMVCVTRVSGSPQAQTCKPSRNAAANQLYEEGLDCLRRKDFVSAEASFRRASS